MCCISIECTIKHRITAKSFLERLGVDSFGSYFNLDLLRWARHASPFLAILLEGEDLRSIDFNALDGQ
jgi:hypothetical protein